MPIGPMSEDVVRIQLNVNGEDYSLSVASSAMLVDVLREELDLIGTKIGCREGECGACTVLVDGIAINSCLLPVLKTQHRTITTIEGLGTADNPHPLQMAFAEEGAVQCGYCTPGLIMSAAALLKSVPKPSRAEILRALAGNLCRCTGYARIVSAVQKASSRMNSDL